MNGNIWLLRHLSCSSCHYHPIEVNIGWCGKAGQPTLDVWWYVLVHPSAAGGSSFWGDWARGTLSQHSTWPPWPPWPLWPLGPFGHKMKTTRRWPLVSNSTKTNRSPSNHHIWSGHITNIFSDNSTWWLFEDNVRIFEAGRIDADALKEDGASWSSRKARVLWCRGGEEKWEKWGDGCFEVGRGLEHVPSLRGGRGSRG